jgi:4-amino-4-deoxy-L-arabinose transferase-like glycosyltransferase
MRGGGSATERGPSAGRARAGRTRMARAQEACRRVPAAAWMCALIALLNATAWSIVTPPFQGRDEVDHFAYTEQIAETGTLPENGHEEGSYSPAESLVMEGLHYYEIRFTAPTHALTTEAEQRVLMRDVHAGASLIGTGEAGVATSQPPLYYALQTIPYFLGRGNILTQLQLMRLVGALLAGITTLLAFLFLRETLPGVRWAASVGALCVALEPLFGFMSGSVNPDTLLVTISAAIFLCLARAFRRGLTRRRAAVLGLLVVAGLLTKLNFIGLMPGVLVGLVVLGVREARSRGRKALPALAIVAGIALAPLILYVLRNVLSSRPTLGALAGPANKLTGDSLFNELSYVWEMYLPRLPGMTHYFQGIATYKDVWFDRSVGLYGWMDTMFPPWVDNVALIPAGAVVLLCGRELVRRRAALRSHLSELGVYAAIALGVLVMLGLASYTSDAITHKDALGEPRYLLPMLPLLGAVIVLAIRGAGRRWGPVVGAAMVVLLLGYDLVSQLQVIARYYG